MNYFPRCGQVGAIQRDYLWSLRKAIVERIEGHRTWIWSREQLRAKFEDNYYRIREADNLADRADNYSLRTKLDTYRVSAEVTDSLTEGKEALVVDRIHSFRPSPTRRDCRIVVFAVNCRSS